MATFNNGDTYLSIRNLLNDTGLRKNTYTENVPPGASDDESAGYEVGSEWLDNVTNTLYYCTDAVAGAAVWSEVGGSFGDADVDTHLNTSTATSGEVLSWTGTDYDWVTQSGGGLPANANIATDFVNLTVTNSAELANVQLELAKYRLTSGAVNYPNGRAGGPIIYINVEPGTYVLSDYFSVQDMVGQVRFQAPGGGDHRANTSIRFDGQMNIIQSHVRFDGLTVISDNGMNVIQHSVLKMKDCNVYTSYTSTSAESYSDVVDCTVCDTSPGANDAEFFWDTYDQAYTFLNRNNYSACTVLNVQSGTGCTVEMTLKKGEIVTSNLTASSKLNATRTGTFYVNNRFDPSPGLLELPPIEVDIGSSFNYNLTASPSGAYQVRCNSLIARNGSIVNFNSENATGNLEITGSVDISDGSHVNFEHNGLIKLASSGTANVTVTNGSSLTADANTEVAGNIAVNNGTVSISGTVTPGAGKNSTLTNASRLVIGDLGSATTITASGHSHADVLADTAGVVGSSTLTANDFSEIITPSGRTGYAVGYDPLTDQIVIGNGASASGNSGIAIGHDATTPLNFATAVGPFAEANGASAVAIGTNAGNSSTSGTTGSIYIGDTTGTSSSGAYQIAIGNSTGTSVSGAQTIAIGRGAGSTNSQPNSISIGTDAGRIGHGEFSIAIGYESGKNGTADNTIGINATGTTVAVGSQFGIDIRTSANGSLTYDTTNAWVFGSSVTVNGTLEADQVITSGTGPLTFDSASTITFTAPDGYTFNGGDLSLEGNASIRHTFDVVNNGSSDYQFTDSANHWFPTAENDPVLYLRRGETYVFDVNASTHPFEIRVSNGGAAYSTGVTNNAADVGQVIFKVPMSAPATLYYQCTVHTGMGNTINIV